MQVVVKGFMGTSEEAIKYIERGYYIGLTGYLCKVSGLDPKDVQVDCEVKYHNHQSGLLNFYRCGSQKYFVPMDEHRGLWLAGC